MLARFRLVSAKDKDTGAEQQVTISETSTLSKVDRMVSGAEAHRSEDARLRELVDARNDGPSRRLCGR